MVERPRGRARMGAMPRHPLPLRRAAAPFLAALVLAAPAARADGLADLNAALARLQGASPVKGQAELRTVHKMGEGSELTELKGQVAASLEDGPRGLQVLYGRDLLARADEERRARARNPQAKTPTADALGELQVTDLQPLAAPAVQLQRVIERSRFTGEKAQPWNGRPARLLTFEMPIESLSERERKYVKQFDAGLDVWVAADGTPLASRLHQVVSGRAYVVVKFEVTRDEQHVYALAGDRLVTARRETRQLSTGMGDRDERQATTTVQWGS